MPKGYVPLSKLANICPEVLREELLPLHYREIARRGLIKLGITDLSVDLNAAAEDIREKYLDEGRHGLIYIPPLGAMGEWFNNAQGYLINPQAWTLRISGNASFGWEGALELALRFPYLQTKNQEVPSRIRWEGASKGYIIEKHVSGWFRQKYPDFWRPPENENKYDKPHKYDFGLEVGSRYLKVDVMGPLRNGLFGMPVGGGKSPTDIHLVSRIDGSDVVLHGYKKKEEIDSAFCGNHAFSSEQTWPISHLLVWLNCKAKGIDYNNLREDVIKFHPKRERMRRHYFIQYQALPEGV